MNLIYDLNSAVNILAAGIVIYSSVLVYRCGLLPKWLLAMFWAVSIGWVGLYFFVLFGHNFEINSIVLGRVFIRPLITLTLATIASTFIYRSRGCQGR